MNTPILPLRLATLVATAFLAILLQPVLAFDYHYSPTNIPPDSIYFNGSATNLPDRFQLTSYKGGQEGAIVLDNLPKTPIKEFTVRFGLRMTNTSSSSVMADGISFNFGPGITETSITSEKGITNGLAVAFDTFKNNTSPYFDPGWVPGISIRWNGQDLITQNTSNIFNTLKTSPDFHDVTVTLRPPLTSGGLSTVVVEYQGVTLQARVQYDPAPGETWRMMFAGRTGADWSEQSINAIDVSGTATQLTVVSPYGNGQTSPRPGTTQPEVFAYTYDPASVQAGVMTFNGSASNQLTSFLLTPNQEEQQGSIVLNNLPQRPFSEFNARIGLKLFNGAFIMADGVSFNFGPDIPGNSLPDETGYDSSTGTHLSGLSVCFDTYSGPSWAPGMAIRWNGEVVTSFQKSISGTNSNFNDAIITLRPAAEGKAVVTVTFQDATLQGEIPYTPPADHFWGMVIGARTGGVSSEQSIDRIELSGLVAQPAVSPDPVGDPLTPSSGLHEITERDAVVLQAPQYVYLDRYRRELDPTPDNIASLAHYRARLDSPAATVTPSGVGASYSVANGSSITVDTDTTVTWHWLVDNLAEVDSGTSSAPDLSATDITDAAHVDTLGRRYLTPGTTGFDSLVYRSVSASQQANARFGSRGYVMENAPNSPERYLELAGDGDYLVAEATNPVMPVGATNYTVEFWARRNLTAGSSEQVVLGLGSLNGAGNRLMAGFGEDTGFFISDGDQRVSALPGWTDEEWHHWAAVYRGNGDTNSVALYRDSVLVHQANTQFAPFRGDRAVTIGAQAVGDYSTSFFSGGVNNVRLWDSALRRTDLQAVLATRQFSNSAAGLLLEMPFDAVPTNSAAGVHVERLSYPIATLTGALRFEAWDGLSTTNKNLDDTLLSDPRYPDSPSTATFTPSFDSRPIYPDDTHDGYGGRISGWITPTETASYRFFLKSDDSSRFYISTNDSPAHLRQMAHLDSYSDTFAESGSATTGLIKLEAGKRYAVEAIWKEDAVADFCTVGWRKEGDPTPAADLFAVPSPYLSAPTFQPPAFSQLEDAILQDAYQTNNFLLPLANDVPEQPEGYGSDAWHYRSRLTVPTSGRYTFSLSASGPAQFWVDGLLLIDNPGTDNASTASISLNPGSHVIETWMIDDGGPRSLSLTYSPKIQSTPLAALPDSSLFLAASDLLAEGQVTTTSTEGNQLVFVARGFEDLFPANTAASTMLAAIMPGFRLGLTSVEGGENTVQIDPIGKAPLDDWRRVFWGWNKEYQFKVGVTCVEDAGLAVVSQLPYFAGEVVEANVDGGNSSTSGTLGSGVVDVLELWLKEGEPLAVGTLYRTLDRRYTLSGITGNLNSFGEITLDKLLDGAHFHSQTTQTGNTVAREYRFPGVFGPGNLNFSYERTIHRVNIPIGQGLDVSSLAAVNKVLVPQLPVGATDLLVDLDGPSASETTTELTGTITGGSGAGWMWDYVGQKWHPTKPGQFTISWREVGGYTNTIEVTAGFPTDTVTRSGFVGFENADGTRQGTSTNGSLYLSSYTFPEVTGYSDGGGAKAHYYYNISPEGGTPAPSDLDPLANDDWFFKEFSYSENNTAQIANTKNFTDTRLENRSVLTYTRRPDPTQVATGDLSRETVTVRVLITGVAANNSTATVGERLESGDDGAGFHSAWINTSGTSRNYNPNIYDSEATVGQWGPIYPVNQYSDTLNKQPLSVTWYLNTAAADEPPSYLPKVETAYTSISYPDPDSSPVIYLSSQMGSEGVGQEASTDGPNYQEMFDPAVYANLATYNQPDRSAIGYNPNEEHAFIAPSIAYQLTGDSQFNLGQSAAFALQNGLNNLSTHPEKYTSDPFVLVQYSVPGSTNASDAYGMKIYAVKTEREGDGQSTFPRIDGDTGTVFDESGLPVQQPSNPPYNFEHYTAFAGSPVVAPYPVNLAIGNVVMPNTIGGNIGAKRALWEDKNGNRWAVAGDGRFYQRYWYPSRPDFWTGENSLPTGTPIAWAPEEVNQADVNAFTDASTLAVASVYTSYWGNDYSVLKKGETLTYAGGEYQADHPASPGLPAVVNMASAEVVYDSKVPSMQLERDLIKPAGAFRYFRFKVLETREDKEDDHSTQIAEITFYDKDGKELAQKITATNPDGKNPDESGPEKAVDGNEYTAWVDDNKAYLYLDFGEAVSPDQFTLTTASTLPERDPYTFKLEYSSDQLDWYEAYSGTAFLPDDRSTELSPPLTIDLSGKFYPFTDLSARVTRPLDRYAVSISQEAIPEDLQPANPDKVQVSGSRWYFKDLPASLGKRFYYDSLVGELVFRGRLNDLESGAPDLTRQPVQPYVLEPNFLNDEDKEKLIELTDEEAAEWTEAIEKLQEASSTEFTTGDEFGLGVVSTNSRPDLVTIPFYDPTDLKVSVSSGVGDVVPASSFGIGSALVATPQFLLNNSQAPAYLVLAENNDPRATGAVALHVIQLSQERYRGSIQVLTPTDPFSEKINLKHTGDFGGNTAEIYYEWWVRDVLPLDEVGTPDDYDPNENQDKPWQLVQNGHGLGLNSIDFEGDPVTTLADKFFFVRYGHKEELMEADGTNDPETGVVSGDSWRNVPPDDSDPDWSFASEESVPFQWAGAANSPQLQADGSRNYIPQLVMGWVKRVLDQVNLYEARYSATFNGDAPATYSSMLMEAGGPYIGAVALNSDKNNIENVGLIALYETVLERAKELTQAAGNRSDGTDQAILLAATRLAFLYQLLGSEAFSDAQNSVVPQSADSSVGLSMDAFAFKNEVANLLQEELALLRGTDFLKAYPAFNRLFWNYFKADGEAFYNATYNIYDVNNDGLIDESDAAQQYPMGHGDAWGHYLSATEMHYELLQRPGYKWLAQPEYYSLLGNVLPVDYLDEKTFATIAADKVRTGAEIVKATYRDAYVTDPEGQWQGYEDTVEPARAWGVSEWSRRVGQGAWFDWMAVNAVTPIPGSTTGTNALEGLDRIDRATTLAETGSVAAGLNEIQQIVDQVNRGLNPLGLDADAMAFQADPYYNGTSWERMPPFKQSLDKAIAAAQNAVAAYEFASQADQQLRRIADDTDALKREALLQDLDYKNRLIAIYGRPYQGTVGPGKIFAEGYDGPDLLTYMYMDVIDPHALKPEVQGEFVWQQSLNNDVIGVGNGLDFNAPAFDPNTTDNSLQTGFLPTGNNEWIFDNFYLTEGSEFGRLILDTPNHHGDEPGEDDTLISVTLPIFETSDFALQAPTDGSWGTRAAYGSIQDGLNAILVDQIALEVALEDYNDYLKKIQVQVFNARQKMDALREDAGFNTFYETESIAIYTWQTYLHFFSAQLADVEKKTIPGEEVVIYDRDGNEEIVPAGPNVEAKAIPNNFTLAGGGDIFAPLRAAFAAGQSYSLKVFDHLQESVKRGMEQLEYLMKISEFAKDAGKETIGRYNEFLEVLKELSLELLEEEGKRGALMAPLQKMNYAAINSQIAEGERLQLERAALNKQIAAKAQRNRYADLVTRLNRTEAMRKYDLALDNALRYAWLAVKTYDYETSLSEGHPASATRLLEEIVKTRTLGNWTDGEPHGGNGGLAEILDELSADYDALQGQIGLNNGQGEANILSLRSEMMRISPDPASDGRWTDALAAARVANLWDVPEFAQYCRPFAPRSAGPQPGLVIEFSTEIASGKNFFGRSLSGLDHAFSPANYATKIRAFTAAFQNYDVDAGSSSPELSISPRFYLVPVGLDRQYASDTQEPTMRSWNVVSQRIPVPYVLNEESLGSYDYQPTMDGLDGAYAERIRFGDSRAFISDYGLTGADDMTLGPLTPGWNSSSRLYGRSAWNTRWLLIIPGATLSADKDAGLERFIATVTDIKLYLETYSNQGM